MSKKVGNNGVFLLKNKTSMAEVLGNLIQKEIISEDENEENKAERTFYKRSGKLGTPIVEVQNEQDAVPVDEDCRSKSKIKLYPKRHNLNLKMIMAVCGSLLVSTNIANATIPDNSLPISNASESEILYQKLQESMKGNSEKSVQLAKSIDEYLKTNATKFNYAICLGKNGQLEECVHTLEQMFVRMNNDNDVSRSLQNIKKFMKTKEMKITVERYWKLVEHEREPTEFEIVNALFYSYLKLWEHESIVKQAVTDIGQLIQLLSVTHLPHYHLEVSRDRIELKLNVKTKKIQLYDCPLSLNSFDLLSAEEVRLHSVLFNRDGVELSEVIVNGFLDLQNIKRLDLHSYYIIIVDMSWKVSLEYLMVSYSRVLSWNKAKWNVNELRLNGIPLVEKSKMEVREMEIIGPSVLDLSCLPQTISKLTLNRVGDKAFNGSVDLPLLKYLKLYDMWSSYSLSHFRTIHFTHVHFYGVREIDVSLLPQSVTHLKINLNQYMGVSVAKIVGRMKKLDKLILDYFPIKQVEDSLSHFKTDFLVINYNGGITPAELLELRKKKIKTIVVGSIKWGTEDFYFWASHLDKRTEHYLLKEGERGKGIEYSEYLGFLQL